MKKKPEETEEEEVEAEEASNGFSLARRKKEEDTGSSLWLITFTDIMALMLTFFVLLYSMSKPEADKWENVSAGLMDGFNSFYNPDFNAGTEDVVNIEKIDYTQALPLTYLRSRMIGLIGEEEELENVVLIQQSKRLILAMPSELLFGAGSAEVTAEGKKALFSLGGALSNIRNRVEIVGHADPRPIEGDGAPFSTNWELSLARATGVAATLQNVGYRRDMIVRGVSSARYDELPADMNEDERLALSRRVDVVVHEDDGSERLMMQFGNR